MWLGRCLERNNKFLPLPFFSLYFLCFPFLFLSLSFSCPFPCFPFQYAFWKAWKNMFTNCIPSPSFLFLFFAFPSLSFLSFPFLKDCSPPFLSFCFPFSPVLSCRVYSLVLSYLLLFSFLFFTPLLTETLLCNDCNAMCPGNTASRSSRLRSGVEHCHPTLVVEEAEEKEEDKEEAEEEQGK